MFPPSCTQTNIHTFAPHVDTQKWTRYPHSHSPYALYTPRSRHHHPQRGSQRPIPELNPLRSGVGTGRPPRQNVFKEDMCSESVTGKCQQYQQKVEGRIISVIDTPGVCDTSMRGQIMRCVEMSLPGPHAFLLVIRLDVRFTDEEKNTVKWIQENFGEDALHYTIILFARGVCWKHLLRHFWQQTSRWMS